MSSKTTGLDTAFIERQHQRLTRLRAALIAATQSAEDEEAQINAQNSGEVLEGEDDAQRLAMLELDGNRVVHDVARLARVERALRKIEDGTYGRSDASGEPIPIARLDAVPEAIYTVAEQQSREAK